MTSVVRRAALTLALALAGVASAAPASSAAVVPHFDPRREHVLVGARAAAGRAAPGGALRLRRRARWSPRLSFGDALVRLRLKNGRRADLLLLYRAQLRRGRVWSAHGLRIRGRRVWPVRVVRGRRSRAGLSALMRRVGGNGRALEVVVGLFGSHLVAQIYDSRSGRHRIAMSVSGLARRGKLVIQARRAVAVELLSWRRACPFPRTRPPWGPQVIAKVAAGVGPRQPLPAGVRLLERLKRPARLVLKGDLPGLLRLHCNGVRAAAVDAAPPWKYVDEAYLKRRRRPVTLGAGGAPALEASYKDPPMVTALLRHWRRRYPRLTRLERIGRSHQGRPIWALAIGADLRRRGDRPSVLLNAAHHGREPLSVDFVLDAIRTLLDNPRKDRRVARWRRELVIWCVPLVNPDGLHAFMHLSQRTGRKNGRDNNGDGRWGLREGVDLNRNYPFRWGAHGQRGSHSRPRSRFYRGPRAASEPEAQAMIKLARRERFVASVSYHTGAVAILAPYTIDGVRNPRRNEAWIVARQLQRQLWRHRAARRARFPLRHKLYTVDGVDQDWHRFAHGTLALLVEGTRARLTTAAARRSLLDRVRPTWTLLLQRFVAGPAISGHVVDGAGHPVKAEVLVRELSPREGERWTTRCPSGRFDRFLPAPGSYRLVIRAPGHASVTRRVQLSRGRLRLRIKLGGRRVSPARCPTRARRRSR